jgi:ribosome biogenesis protein ENP2
MASVQVINGVSIYNLASGKSLPGWVSASKKKALKKQADFARRLEVLQDFSFPEASQTVSVSGDGRYVVATGTYPPRVRVWDTTELSMKFERYMDSTPVAHAVLSSDYAKLAFLQEDRNLEVHAAYGRHYRTRIPMAGRGLAWHAPTAELLVACSGPEVYRLSLEEGRFMAPMTLHAASPAANKVVVHTVTALIGVACEGGAVELFDPRSSRRAGRLDVAASAGAACDATALGFEEGGMGLTVGTSTGLCCVYDLRQAQPLHKKFHPYRLPVLLAAFHRGPSKLVLSADAQQVKLWSKETGENFSTIELSARLNALALASDAPGTIGSADSGLLLGACEQDRMLAYYVPALGPAPRWASFLDALTEEVDGYGPAAGVGAGAPAGGVGSVYDDFKFLTREELEALGLTNLIGTPMLKPYMHGFWMDARLHSKVWSAADPAVAHKWRAETVKAAVEAQRGSRVEVERDLPAVNPELAAKLRRAAAEEEAAAGAEEEEDEEEEEGGGRGGRARAQQAGCCRLWVGGWQRRLKEEEAARGGRGRRRHRRKHSQGRPVFRPLHRPSLCH